MSGATRWWRSRLVAVVLTVALAVILFSVFIVTRETDLAEGTPVPAPAASPTSTIAPTAPSAATPEESVESLPAGSLPALLAIAPDTLDDETSGLPIEATYANLDGWLASEGMDADDLDDGELERLLELLPLPEVLETRGMTTEWRAMYGFDLRQVDQVLAVGHAPNQILIMPGSHDAETLLATWTANGYQAVEVEETTVWSLFPGDRIDLSAPASRPALGSMNTVALLDDGTLIAAARQSRMAEALRAVQGGDSLLDNDLLRDAAVLDVNATSPSVMIASGRLLQQPTLGGTIPGAAASPSGVGTTVAESDLPPVDLVVFALGAPGDGRWRSISMTMVYDDPHETEGIPAVIEDRVSTDASWSGRYRLDSVTVAGADDDMVRVDITPLEEASAGSTLVDERELGPFTWIAAQ
ncbi:MAG TPA: hypothetical protein VD789_09660 [Thermomicrobiales bacterium]|nr:hypothetical protein [Thermomicrobiales bacterium]